MAPPTGLYEKQPYQVKKNYIERLKEDIFKRVNRDTFERVNVDPFKRVIEGLFETNERKVIYNKNTKIH